MIAGNQCKCWFLQAIASRKHNGDRDYQKVVLYLLSISVIEESVFPHSTAIPNSECLSCTDRSVEICICLASPF